MQFHPTIRVTVDFFPSRTDNRGDLRAVHHRFIRHRGAPRCCPFHHRKTVTHRGRFTTAFLFQRLRLLPDVRHAHRLPHRIQRRIRVLRQGKRTARHQPRAVGFPFARHGSRPQRIQPVAAERLAARVLFIASRIVVMLVAFALVFQLTAHLLVRQPVSRRLEAIVFQLDFGRAHPLCVVEAPNVFPLAQPLCGEIEEQLGAFGQRARIVGKHHPVFAFFVFVEEVHAFLRGKTGDKRQIAFPILHAVFPHRMFVAQCKGVVGDASLFQQHADNGFRLLCLKNTGVGAQPQSPQRRTDFYLIACAPKTGVALREATDNPADPAFQLAFIPNHQLARLVQHRAEIDIRQRASQTQRQAERPVQPFIQPEIHYCKSACRQGTDLNGKL
ncbi:hypothetical protein Q7O_004243 [Pectobacterium carotovorum subsp. carotovorum PCCS1]|nr:hypothetical protein [Pectobacterium carotovorum subsp. carotovorum PCCS1]